MGSIRRLAVADVDNTLARGYYIWKFAKYLAEKDYFRPESIKEMLDISHEYMDEGASRMDYETFARRWVQLFGRGIKGIERRRIEGLGKQYVSSHGGEIFGGAGELIAFLNGEGFTTLALSASPADIVLPFAEAVGIRKTLATTYRADGRGVYTGKVGRTNVVGTKADALGKFMMQRHLDRKILKESAGFGDSPHDVSFLSIVGYPYAIKPDDELRRVAEANGWDITDSPSDALKLVKARLAQDKT
jgi:phosphoserine phosphatase